MTTNLAEFAGAEREDMIDSCKQACESLSQQEKVALDKIMLDLESAVRGGRPTGQGLGYQSRMELLAKLGLWLADHESGKHGC